MTEVYLSPYGSLINPINPAVNVVVVAGGGGGGGSINNDAYNAGGGAGGYIYTIGHKLTATSYPITIGAGGAGGLGSDKGSSTNNRGLNGANTVFDTITAIGGGGGGCGETANLGPNGGAGQLGGSGGGGGRSQSGGAGTSGQGYNGGSTANTGGAGGGGGAGAVGSNGNTSNVGGAGGVGILNPITSSWLAGGGGGGGATPGAGGNGGGGAGASYPHDGNNATANTGGGGGGGSVYDSGGNGGSGIVIISYHTDGSDGISPASTGGTITTVGVYTVHTFTSNGTFTPVFTPAIPGWFPLDLIPNLPMPYSKSIIDLTSLEGGPGVLLGGGSKTLIFPGTKNNNKVFGFIFEINLADGSFNTLRRSYARVFQDRLPIIDGILRLQNVNITGDYIQYECQITDGVSSFYTAMNIGSGANDGAELTDLLMPGETIPFDSLNHDYIFTNIYNSWSAPQGKGYVYPMIDYGQNDLHGWFVNQFYPAVYVKEYMDRIFAYCGYTYSSAFFNSALFKSLIVPCNNIIAYTAAEVVLRQAIINLSASHTFGAGSYSIPFDVITADPSSQWNASTKQFTVAQGGTYNFYCYIQVTAITSVASLQVTVVRGGVTIFTNNQYIPGVTGGFNVSTGYGLFDAGDIVTFGVTVNTSMTIANTSYFTATVQNNAIAEGQMMLMNSAVPINIKLQDFFESICKMFCLHIDLDPVNPYNLIIEPYASFYDGPTLNWTEKQDHSQQTVITPMGLLNSKNYLFTYTTDNDYWNQYYTNRYFTLDHQDIYGERQIGTENDYLTNNQKTDIIFAPTPLVLYNTGVFAPGGVPNTKIMSTIHMGSSAGNDPVNNPQQIQQSIIRIMIFNPIAVNAYGNNTPSAWQISSSLGTPSWNPVNIYPYAGHLDNPYTLTTSSVDINFGVPAAIYFQSLNGQYTNNNLYNAYYSAFMAEITDKDSKVVTMYLRLKFSDIYGFTFRSLILIDGTYYKVLEITDYDFATEKPTQVKLLKSDTQPPFVPITGQTGGSGLIGSESLPDISRNRLSPYLQLGSVVGLGGQGNIISDNAINVLITGDNNQVQGSSYNVAIHGGSGNTVNGNNITLINCTSLTVNDNNAVYVNNVKYQPISSMSGTATMASGSTAPIAFAGVSATSIIMAFATDSGTFTGTITANPGTNTFTINSSVGTDHGTVGWLIVKL